MRDLSTLCLARLPLPIRRELGFWLVMLFSGTDPDPLRQRRRVAASVDHLADRPDLQVWAMIALGTPCGTGTVALPEHLRWLHRTLGAVPRVSPPVLAVPMLGQIAAILVSVGDPAWRRLADQMLAPASPVGTAAVTAYQAIAGAACHAGQYDVARRLLAGTHRRPGTVLGQRSLMRWALLDFCHGRWHDLRARVEWLASELAARTPARLEPEDAAALIEADAVAGCLALAEGNLDQARQRLADSVAAATRAGRDDLLPIPGVAQIRLATSLGEDEEAMAIGRRLATAVAGRGAWAPYARLLPALADAMIAAGHAADVPDMLNHACDQIRGLDVPLGPAATDMVRGLVAGQARQWLPAAAHLTGAADRYEWLGCRYEAAQSRERAAGCLFQAGDPRAVRVLRAAAATYEHLGASWDLARAHRMAAGFGLPLLLPGRPGRGCRGDQLSPRQRQVAQLAADGLTNEQIAQRLALSARTVDKHVCAALRKLGLHSRRSLGPYL